MGSKPCKICKRPTKAPSGICDRHTYGGKLAKGPRRGRLGM